VRALEVAGTLCAAITQYIAGFHPNAGS